MKIAALIGFAFAVSATLAIERWVSGYFIQLAPFGFFTPLVMLGLLLTLLALVIWLIVTTVRASRPIGQKSALVLIILVIALLPFFTPSSLSGFEHRVRQTSDASWLDLAREVQRMHRARTEKKNLLDFADREWSSQTAQKLAETHPILKLGDFPPVLLVEEDSVYFMWGSGLIGTLAVNVSTNPDVAVRTPSSDRGKRISNVVAISWD